MIICAQAFEVDALDYILKPFDEERIVQTLKKYKNKTSANRNEARNKGDRCNSRDA